MVILENETFEKYGYYARDLKPKSNKRILAACDDCGKIREIRKNCYHALCKSCAHKRGHITEETRKKLSDAAKDHICSKETRKKIGDANRGEKIKRICLKCGKHFEVLPSIVAEGKGKYCSTRCADFFRCENRRRENNNNWKGGKIPRICLFCQKPFEVLPAVVKKGHGKYCSCSCAAKAQKHSARAQKTKPELIFEGICEKYDLPFLFVGDGSLWIGNANPDFIHKTRKLCVEIYGDYWHSPLLNVKIRYNHTLEGRKKQLKEEGYKLIVLWESDLKRPDSEAFVLSTLEKNKIKF